MFDGLMKEVTLRNVLPLILKYKFWNTANTALSVDIIVGQVDLNIVLDCARSVVDKTWNKVEDKKKLGRGSKSKLLCSTMPG